MKTQKIIAGAGGDQTVTLERRRRQRAASSPTTQVLAIAHLVLDAEDHFGCPQDLEWCYESDGVVHVVQTRPITTLPASGATAADAGPAAAGHDALVTGLGASPGIASGAVRVLDLPR